MDQGLPEKSNRFPDMQQGTMFLCFLYVLKLVAFSWGLGPTQPPPLSPHLSPHSSRPN